MTHSAPTPVGLHLDDGKRTFVVRWEDGRESRIPYRALRLACRCALCIEETTGRPLLDPESVPDDVGVVDCQQVGLYGVQIRWSDGHGTGIMTWERLLALGGDTCCGQCAS